ncbi:hypothetical protein [Streptomyces sp. AC550_RSS872]|nr:hypothetical protein [Streptomyces sp. AC550_RSS872]
MTTGVVPAGTFLASGAVEAPLGRVGRVGGAALGAAGEAGGSGGDAQQ